ncbi:LexA family protein [Phyllobacterium endophyticum]|uniref:Peptidase S24 n=1 Tax=Phyllobacterium endophyticum TaxID=1149773 RepID=A0A2P7AUM2_9HYPH|nr:LexA family transcriptional regulator [Phyllobacterium endophyticum]MBB3234402.1 phage repressor protein C with HTH and peptisase S24 domain [Phyllobacterium endophyticum]PSH57920.1 peptidase S24 [Phyllobacterium endophyticum]TYR44127.1 helix-turn-helix transcriptional regulator [Phyllobacterium endophyticum]
MIEDPYIKWVVENLEQPGKTQTGLAESLGLHPSAINKVVKGKRQLKSHEVAAAATYFGVQAPSPEIRPSIGGLVPVPVVGKTEAGSFREVDEFDQSEQVFMSLPPDDRFPGARQMAFDVEGDSMNALKPRPIFPGDRAVGVAYEDVAHEATLRDGMIVVVQRTRDGGHTREWSVKQVEIYADRTEFHPRSTNPKHKPIVITRDMHADEGTTVEIIMLVRRIINDLPLN